MEENQKKKINKKVIIFAVVIIALIIMLTITFSAVNGKKKTKLELGNISNMGLAASNDQGVFYNKYEEGIVKVKGGEESQITNETAYSINLNGDDIYYISVNDTSNIAIKKVKTNGSGMTTIKTIHTSISKIYLENNYIYYATNDNGGGISKMKLDGSDEKVIISNAIKDFEVVEEKVYYSDKLGDLYFAKTTGIEAQRITPENKYIKEFQVKDDWIYYYNEDEKNLCKVKIDGTDNQIVSNAVNSNIYNVAKDGIYFFDEANKKIAYINFKGDNYKEIVPISTNKTKINIVGDTIYYLDASTNASKIYQMYRIKTNGSKAKVIEY